MHESCVCLGALFVNAMHTCVMGGIYLHAQVDYLSKCTVCTKWGGKNYLCPCVTGVCMSRRAILDLKSSISHKAYTSSGDCGQVGASWWGGNMHSGYDHTAAKYGCHSKAEVHTQFNHKRERQPNAVFECVYIWILLYKVIARLIYTVLLPLWGMSCLFPWKVPVTHSGRDEM